MHEHLTEALARYEARLTADNPSPVVLRSRLGGAKDFISWLGDIGARPDQITPDVMVRWCEATGRTEGKAAVHMNIQGAIALCGLLREQHSSIPAEGDFEKPTLAPIRTKKAPGSPPAQAAPAAPPAPAVQPTPAASTPATPPAVTAAPAAAAAAPGAFMSEPVLAAPQPTPAPTSRTATSRSPLRETHVRFWRRRPSGETSDLGERRYADAFQFGETLEGLQRYAREHLIKMYPPDPGETVIVFEAAEVDAKGNIGRRTRIDIELPQEPVAAPFGAPTGFGTAPGLAAPAYAQQVVMGPTGQPMTVLVPTTAPTVAGVAGADPMQLGAMRDDLTTRLHALNQSVAGLGPRPDPTAVMSINMQLLDAQRELRELNARMAQQPVPQPAVVPPWMVPPAHQPLHQPGHQPQPQPQPLQQPYAPQPGQPQPPQRAPEIPRTPIPRRGGAMSLDALFGPEDPKAGLLDGLIKFGETEVGKAVLVPVLMAFAERLLGGGEGGPDPMEAFSQNIDLMTRMGLLGRNDDVKDQIRDLKDEVKEARRGGVNRTLTDIAEEFEVFKKITGQSGFSGVVRELAPVLTSVFDAAGKAAASDSPPPALTKGRPRTQAQQRQQQQRTQHWQTQPPRAQQQQHDPGPTIDVEPEPAPPEAEAPAQLPPVIHNAIMTTLTSDDDHEIVDNLGQAVGFFGNWPEGRAAIAEFNDLVSQPDTDVYIINLLDNLLGSTGYGKAATTTRLCRVVEAVRNIQTTKTAADAAGTAPPAGVEEVVATTETPAQAEETERALQDKEPPVIGDEPEAEPDDEEEDEAEPDIEDESQAGDADEVGGDSVERASA